jgi:hypothetical protein
MLAYRGVNELSLGELCLFKLGLLNFCSSLSRAQGRAPKLCLSSSHILTEPSPSQLMKL